MNVFFNDEGWNFEEEKRKAELENERLEKKKAEKERKKEERKNKFHKLKELCPKVGGCEKNKWLRWIIISFVIMAMALTLVLVFALPRDVDLEGNGTYNGYEYVDLGLPSGTLWATCNVGASKPEEYGDYFAWGETYPKAMYDWDTYEYAAAGGYRQMTKYCNNPEYGYKYGYKCFADKLVTLQSSDDPAIANWSSGWCSPTKEQWEDLERNTSNRWKKQNGVRGRLFTAKNGKRLFLPAAGDIRGDDWRTCFRGDGYRGSYWSRSLDILRPYGAECLFLIRIFAIWKVVTAIEACLSVLFILLQNNESHIYCVTQQGKKVKCR